MLKCSVLRGLPVGLGAPSGSISSGVPLMSATALSKSAIARSNCRTRDVAMAAVAVQPRVVGVLRDALREHRNRILVAPQITEPAADPDDRVGVVRLRREVLFGLREIGFELGALGELDRIERLARQRRRFGLRCRLVDSARRWKRAGGDHRGSTADAHDERDRSDAWLNPSSGAVTTDGSKAASTSADDFVRQPEQVGAVQDPRRRVDRLQRLDLGA